jgi:hypothetical protein
MKSADYASALVAPFLDLIHGLNDGIAGAAFKAEKRCFGDTNQIQAANWPKSVRSIFTQAFDQQIRVELTIAINDLQWVIMGHKSLGLLFQAFLSGCFSTIFPFS